MLHAIFGVGLFLWPLIVPVPERLGYIPLSDDRGAVSRYELALIP